MLYSHEYQKSDLHGKLKYKREADTLTKYLRCVRKIGNDWNSDVSPRPRLWYRGHGDAGWDLAPSVLRPKFSNFRAEECGADFRLRANPYLSDAASAASDDLEWYFVMQHHGVPTRLLDWSENPLVALYFALRDFSDGRSPAVWVLNPVALNDRVAQVGLSVLPTSDPRLLTYLGAAFSELPSKSPPIAIQPPHKTRRLTAQKGVFTLHGKDRRAIADYEELLGHLTRIEIVADKSDSIRDELAAAGVTETTVFPELAALCRELVEHWTDRRNAV